MPRFACLFGNGASRIYNDDLAISPLTAAIVDRYAALAGVGTAGDALAGFAEVFHGETRDDFEGLLGPLDAATEALPFLTDLAASVGGGPEIHDATAVLADHIGALHRLGLARALELIAERTHNAGPGHLGATVGQVGNAILALDGMTTVATLNYDGLLHSCLIDDPHVVDLAAGFDFVDVPVVDGGPVRRGYPLRTNMNLPDGTRVVITQLHGSLGWLRSPDGVRRFAISDLRADHYWERLADNETAWMPVVVLTDRKERVVATEPFSFAYEVFRSHLAQSDRWLIAGYSFQDRPVNGLLHGAIVQRLGTGLPAPRVLVLGHGPEDELRDRVLESVPNAGANLEVDGGGLPDSVQGHKWVTWATP